MFAMLLRVHFANVPNLTLWEWESSALIASADLLSLEALTAQPPPPLTHCRQSLFGLQPHRPFRLKRNRLQIQMSKLFFFNGSAIFGLISPCEEHPLQEVLTVNLMTIGQQVDEAF